MTEMDILAIIKEFGPIMGTSVIGAVLTLLGIKEFLSKWQAHEQERELLALKHILAINESLMKTTEHITLIQTDIAEIRELLKKYKINGRIDTTGKVQSVLDKLG